MDTAHIKSIKRWEIKMSYTIQQSESENEFWRGYYACKFKEWDGVNRRKRIRGIVRTPYSKVTILQPMIKTIM